MMLGYEHVTDHFKRFEIDCNCGCGTNNIDTKSIVALNSFRDYIDQRIIIKSACRCRKHNKKVGGVSNSLHIADASTPCLAFDIVVIGWSPWTLMKKFESWDVAEFFSGRGVYPDQHIIHIDSGHQKTTRWLKYEKKAYRYLSKFDYPEVA